LGLVDIEHFMLYIHRLYACCLSKNTQQLKYLERVFLCVSKRINRTKMFYMSQGDDIYRERKNALRIRRFSCRLDCGV